MVGDVLEGRHIEPSGSDHGRDVAHPKDEADDADLVGEQLVEILPDRGRVHGRPAQGEAQACGVALGSSLPGTRLASPGFEPLGQR